MLRRYYIKNAKKILTSKEGYKRILQKMLGFRELLSKFAIQNDARSYLRYSLFRLS